MRNQLSGSITSHEYREKVRYAMKPICPPWSPRSTILRMRMPLDTLDSMVLCSSVMPASRARSASCTSSHCFTRESISVSSVCSTVLVWPRTELRTYTLSSPYSSSSMTPAEMSCAASSSGPIFASLATSSSCERSTTPPDMASSCVTMDSFTVALSNGTCRSTLPPGKSTTTPRVTMADTGDDDAMRAPSRVRSWASSRRSWRACSSARRSLARAVAGTETPTLP
mmetsp:Transcript_14429/g.48812  ORF Transcript_14429/g.48812 Transcript_14429/m.48812 type:complete len:226 (+) Transcript_14429:289-966(+)